MSSVYLDDTYLAHNPDWHARDAGWKAGRIEALLRRHGVPHGRVAEVGCGVGHVLAELSRSLPAMTAADGYDISPVAIARAKMLESDRLCFHCADFLSGDHKYDLVLLIDVVEYVEDYIGFLRSIRNRAKHIIVHLPLEMHALAVLRDSFGSAREKLGHLHYFTLSTGLASVKDAGYHVRDYTLTRGTLELGSARKGLRTDVANGLRRILELFSTEAAARVLGGYSVLLLAEPAGVE